VVISKRALLLAGAAFPASAYGQCVINAPAVDACMGGVRNAGPAGATLDLNFMFPGSLDPRITFTRASTATWTDASGVIQTAAVNQPRWEARGLLIEEARTNLLLNSATLGTQSVAVTAQAYTLSFYGTGTVTKSGAATGALVGTGAGQRVSQTFTPTAGTLTCTVTGSVTNAQIEAGSFGPTSWIPTTGSSATRAQDLPSLATTGGWFSTVSSTWFAEFICTVPAPINARVIGVIPGPGMPSPMFVNNPVLGAYDGAVAIQTVNALTPGAVSRGASAANPGKICLNGGAIAAGAQTPINAATFGLMQYTPGPSTDNLTGYLRRVQYWPRALSDAEMIQVTT
jgi:hypothetical protein